MTTIRSSGGTSCVCFPTVTSDKPDHVEHFTHPEVSDDPRYALPHIKEKLPLGIALSGGGFRAATCATGFIRGLHQTKLDGGKGPSVLSQARYLSSTSGGSWFNAAFSYKKVPAGGMEKTAAEHKTDLDTFLGPTIAAGSLNLGEEPGQLGLDRPHFDKSFEKAIATDSTCDDLLLDTLVSVSKTRAEKQVAGALETAYTVGKALLFLDPEAFSGPDASTRDQDTGLKQWTKAVAESFLQPFGLWSEKDNSTVSAAGTQDEYAAQRAAEYADTVLLACTDESRPYPILTGTAYNERGDDGYALYPLEFTPLYYGTAAPFPYSEPPLGGGYMEPWGLNTTPGELKCSPDGCTWSVDLPNKKRNQNVSLARAMSISSGFLASAAYQTSEALKDYASTEKLENWGVLPWRPATDGSAPTARSRVMGFADGGALDNLAIMPLLRRGVKCLIVLMASSTAPDNTWKHFANEKNDIAALFGAAQDTATMPGMAPGELNSMCHVFGSSSYEGEQHFRDLFESLQSNLRAGLPGFHKGSYKVRENKFFHIPSSGDETVEVLWIHNQQFADWERSLPPKTYERLQKDRGDDPGVHNAGCMKREPFDGQVARLLKEGKTGLDQKDFRRFPYFTTYSLKYSNQAVRLLSQQSTAVIMHRRVQELIQGLVDKARKQQAKEHAATAQAQSKPAGLKVKGGAAAAQEAPDTARAADVTSKTEQVVHTLA